MDILIAVVYGTVIAGTPLLYAAMGELVTEKSGVLNLGVEGMMLLGAVGSFAYAIGGGNLGVAVLAGALCGMLGALIFAVLTLNLLANQVATGLAVSIFGAGISGFLGQRFSSLPLDGFKPLRIAGLSDIPLLGPILFSYDALVYLSWLLPVAVAWLLYRSRYGLVLRAVGESPSSATAIGYPVIAIRYAATLFGGALAGVGGAYMSLAYTPMWIDNMTAGRGWIALALVVFATWRPARVVVGAYLFGGVTVLQLQAQAVGAHVPAELLNSLPYLATIIVLVLISRDPKLVRLNAPVSLGQAFRAEG